MGIFSCVKDPYWTTLPSKKTTNKITPLPDGPTKSIQVEISCFVVLLFGYNLLHQLVTK